MLNKLYSLLASILFLTACTSEDMWKGSESVDGTNEMAISFSVDVPPASIMTRATSVPTDEKGVEDLTLFTFDQDGTFMKRVKPSVSGSGYRAIVGKGTRSIVFLSNYSKADELIPENKDSFKSLSTDEYVFWAECSVSEGTNVELGVVGLLRNWAKIQVLNKLGSPKLTDIGYCVYKVSTKATMAPVTEGVVNVPTDNSLTLPNDSDFKSIGEANPTYLFENSNQNSKTATFVIIRGKYNGATSYSYYKVDLSSTNQVTGASYVYDVIRNYQFNINLKAIERKGVSWAEVIDENKIPDYNIITSVELVKYPSITFGDESLTVTNTTFIFTNSNGSRLDMKAVYKKGGVEYSDEINVLKSADPNFAKVVDGDISNTSGAISATILGAGDQEISTSFYVRGGDVLQRKITLILRPAYDFVTFSADPATLTNGKTTLKFSIPEDLNPARNPLMESVYPLECRIYTKKLYAVEEGVRIETTGNGDYYYAYVIQNYQSEYSVAFKANENSFTEDVRIAADLFNDKQCSISAVGPVNYEFKAMYPNSSGTDVNMENATINWSYGSKSGVATKKGSNSYSISIPAEDKEKEISLSYIKNKTNGEVEYRAFTKLNNANVTFRPVRIEGTFKYSRSSSVPIDTKAFVCDEKGNTISECTVTKTGWYDFEFPQNLKYGEKLYIECQINKKTYKSVEKTFASWTNASDVQMTVK